MTGLIQVGSYTRTSSAMKRDDSHNGPRNVMKLELKRLFRWFPSYSQSTILTHLKAWKCDGDRCEARPVWTTEITISSVHQRWCISRSGSNQSLTTGEILTRNHLHYLRKNSLIFQWTKYNKIMLLSAFFFFWDIDHKLSSAVVGLDKNT